MVVTSFMELRGFLLPGLLLSKEKFLLWNCKLDALSVWEGRVLLPVRHVSEGHCMQIMECENM